MGAIESEPLAFELHFFYGRCLRTLGRLGEACEAFRRVTFLEPDFAFGHYELANCLHVMEEYDAAVAGYERAVKLSQNKTKPQALKRLAISRENFWLNDSFVLHLCRENREKSLASLPPIGKE